MEKINTIVYGLVSLVVIVLVVATVAIPVVSDVQQQQTIEKNNESPLYTMLPLTDTLTMSIGLDGNTVTVDGVDMPGFSGNYRSKAIVFSDQFIISSHTASGVRGLDVAYNGAYTQSLKKVDITVSNGSAIITRTNSSDVETVMDPIEVEYLFYTDVEGKGTYGAWINNESGYWLNNDKTAYVLAGNYTSTLGNYYSSSSYNKTDGAEGIMYCHGSGSTYTVNDYGPVIDTIESNGYASKIYVSSYGINLTISGSEEPTEYELTSIILIAPIEYTAIDSGGMIYILLGVIPLILAIIPIMIAAQLISNRRD